MTKISREGFPKEVWIMSIGEIALKEFVYNDEDVKWCDGMKEIIIRGVCKNWEKDI